MMSNSVPITLHLLLLENSVQVALVLTFRWPLLSLLLFLLLLLLLLPSFDSSSSS